MDWVAVFAAAGGTAAFVGAAKFVAQKVVEQVISDRRATKLELTKLDYAKDVEHSALIARAQLDVLGALLDAIYPLKTTLAKLNLDAQRFDSIEFDAVVDRIDATIQNLEANLGAKRPYIPNPFDVTVHSLKNELYSVRSELAGYLSLPRGRKSLTEKQSARVRECLLKLARNIEHIFGGLIGEAQRRIAGAAAATD